MVSETREISLKEYKALERMEPKKAYQWIEDYANRTGCATAGYGFYSPFKYQDQNGKCYIKWFRGDSCD